jgi:serine phosphatase RsbU (regulator of sigma subunit)
MPAGGFVKKVLSFLLNIGADPRDSEYLRIVKRIYYMGSVPALPLTIGLVILFFLQRDYAFAATMFVSFVFFLWFSINGSKYPQNFLRNATYLTYYFVLAPFVLTLLEGGIWNANGAIYIGFMGPIYALLLPKKRRALFLFGLYAVLVIAIVILQPYFAGSISEMTGIRLFIFWYGLLIIAAFVFGGTYFFVIQRDKAHHLLGLEKEKSEKLLNRIEKDLERAAAIQRDLLPKENPEVVGFEIAGSNIPCYQVGGDYYDFIPVDKERLGVVVADVAGKGMGASLLMASLRAALLAEINPQYDILEMSQRLNSFVYQSSPMNSFITFFFCDVNRVSGELRYINAGHNPPLILNNSGEFSSLDSTGMALGMFPDARFESGSIRLESEEMAILFTDGIPEGRNKAQEEYTEERLRNLILSHQNLSVQLLEKTVLDDVASFSEGTEQADDITLVLIKRQE